MTPQAKTAAASPGPAETPSPAHNAATPSPQPKAAAPSPLPAAAPSPAPEYCEHAATGDLRKDSVDGGLQGHLQRVEVSCRGEGPGVLEGRYLRVVPVQAGVPEGQRGVHRGLLDKGQQGRCDELAHVGGRGPESHSGGEVAGADHGEQRGGDGLGDVACRLAGRHVQGQLVHDALERVRGCDAGQRRVVGRGDATVHCCRGGMVGELQIHRSGRVLAVDLDLEGVQGGLAARPRVRLVLTAVRPEALAAMRPSAAARSLARAKGVRSGAAGRAATWPCRAAIAAVLVPMSAVCWVAVSRGVYWVRTRLSCPAEMPCNSITGGSVTPSSRTRPVRVDGNSDISVSREQTRRFPTRSQFGRRGDGCTCAAHGRPACP